MKRQMPRVMVGIGLVGTAILVLAVIMAIAEGYLSDDEHTTGNLVPATLTGLLGAGVMLLGFGSALFRRE